ncbi:MAG: HEAT repeat domain-containing protein [Methanoregula sp.]
MDIEAMKNDQDIRGLIRLLDHRKNDVQWRAADALGTLGEIACEPLLRPLVYPKIHVRIGAIEALGAIKSPQSVEPLIHTLRTDESSEVRWVAALALGEIGDKRAIPPLLASLKDEDRYVRYGSVKALEQIGWSAETDRDRAYYYLALQDWDTIKKLGKSATGPLIDLLKDQHPAIRAQITEILSSIGGVEAKKSCEHVLRDPDENVRWCAVLSSLRCDVPTSQLPLELSKRQRSGPSVFGAALLNFFFLGLGYDYLGKWWGLVVLEIYMVFILTSQLLFGLLMTVIIWIPITALFATQTFLMAKRESALSG